MTAYPWIVDATGFYPGISLDSVTMMALYENKEIEGHTEGQSKFVPFKFEGGVCYYNPGAPESLVCSPVTKWNLKNLQFAEGRGLGAFNFGCIESSYCPDTGCTAICSTNWVRVSLLSGIPIRTFSTSAPNQPPNLTITPGNGELTISWGAVTNIDVFAYDVEVLSGNAIVAGGWTENTLRSVTIGNLQNGVAYSVRVFALSRSGIKSVNATGTGTPVGATNPVVYNIYTTPDTIVAGSPFTITAKLANTGPNGKVRAVFKVGGTQISDQNSTLNTFPGGGLWSPTTTYTVPNITITITVTVEAYGWDGTKWVLTDTKSITITPSVPSCTSISIGTYPTTVKAGDKVSIPVSVTPTTQPFTVKLKLNDGTVIGQCVTSNGACTIIWDTAGKTPGIYYFNASVEGQCVSAGYASLSISPAINQWNMNIYVRDSVTGTPIAGATVTVGTQSKATDATGLAMFRVDEGTINISISKTGYNTFTTVEPVFSDKTFNYSLSPTGIAKGSIHFVSVPVGAGIFIDGADQGVKTNSTVTDIPAGEHPFTLKLAGYNDFAGKVTVIGGSTVEVYVVLTPSTPTTGALYVASTPVAADITIDNQPQGVNTPATITNLTAGSHEVKLTKTGYQDLTQTVTITAGTTTYLNVSLTVLPGIGTLEISSTPAGARVFIDGADVQKVTPATITNLSSGSHAYKLVLSGYKDATGTSTIEPGKTTPVSVQLKKAEAVAGTGTIIGLGLLGAGVLGAIVYFTMEKRPEYTLPGTRRD